MSDGSFKARRPLLVGFGALFTLVGTLGYWSVSTKIAGAVVASGQVQVQTDRQIVQHPDGGVVSEILVQDGDVVSAGDVLLRLDGTFLRSELLVAETQIAEVTARSARLRAERDGLPTPNFQHALTFAMLGAGAIKEQTDGQLRLFEARSASLNQETRRLREQIVQTEQQIEGIEAQIESAERQSELIESELANVQELFDQGLVQATRLLELQREEARLDGQIGQLFARAAEARTTISAIEIEILKLSDTRRETSINELRDLELRLAELVTDQVTLTVKLSRLEVRAPVSGVVFDRRVVALNSVVRPAEPILYLVPANQPLEVSSRIDPVDVDQVQVGQSASLVFTTFNSRTTPEIPGIVQRVSADAELDELSNQTFYEAVVSPDKQALASLQDVVLIPGMPVEVFIKSNDRTPISYLSQPLTIYFDRAFREE